MSDEITLHFKNTDGEVRTVDARIGSSVMETAVGNDIDEVVAECGGCLICATCHVYLAPETAALFEEPEEDELDMLESTAADRREHSRLSCQLKVMSELDGHTIELPARQ